MRYLGLLLVLSGAVVAQAPPSQTNVYTYDGAGNRTLASQQVAGAGLAEQRTRNLNGRLAPLEKVEEKVLRDDGVSRVVEKIIRPFDANGAPQPPQRIVQTETRQPDGAKSVETQVFQGNINGGYSLTERSQGLERSAGGRVTIETQVARPTLNGALETLEKRTSTITTSGESTNEETLTYRRDTNGSFYPAVRLVKEAARKDDRTVENAATYISGDRRQLELAGQTVTETTRRPDGSETRQVNVFGTAAPGRPATGKPTLREQQIIERSKTASGAVEILSVRRPAVDNPNALGPAQKISEKVCTGPCQ